jgi:RHS repeat-associated protein
MSVWAKYASTSGVSEIPPSQLIFSALTSAFGVSGGSTGEALQIYNGLNTAVGASYLFNQSPNDVPEANLNYLFFDNNYVFQSGGAVQVNSTNYAQLTNSFTANKDGILFIYLANESTLNANVYFDDLQIIHTSSNATLQADDFYPFGLPMDNNGFLEAGVKANRFLYQGKEWQTDLGLNLYDFHARQFDPALGRWLAQDPKSQFSSPYNGMGNMPTVSVDPDGQLAWFVPIIIGAALNVGSQAIAGNINNFWDGLGFAAVGGLAGYLGGISPAGILPGAGFGAASGGAIGALNASISGDNIGRSALWGGAAGAVFGGIKGFNAAKADPFKNNITGGWNLDKIKEATGATNFPSVDPGPIKLDGVSGLPRPETATLQKAIDFNTTFKGPDLQEFVVEAFRPVSYFDIAQTFAGAIYETGSGKGMSDNALDCSGLVCRATGNTERVWWTGKDGGPPGSWETVNSRTSSIKDFLSDAKKGDLFVWRNQGHAAFYGGKTGNTHLLFHASSSKGVGFTRDLLTYYLNPKYKIGYPTVYRQVFK